MLLAETRQKVETNVTVQQRVMLVFSLPNPGSSGLSQRKPKGAKAATAPAPMAPSGARYGDGAAAANGGLTLRDPVTGAQYVQIQLLQVKSPDILLQYIFQIGRY